MLSDVPKVLVRNQSHALSAAQTWNIAWALGYQVRWQFGPLWKIGCEVLYPPPGVAVPAGAWILDLLDTSDTENALGYHDEDGNEVPYGRVFIKTAQENGAAGSEVASHELMELLVDPHVNATAFDPKSGRLYAYEVGDPAQGGAYDIGAPYSRTTGIIVSDFTLPSWFDPNTGQNEKTSYRGVCTGPFGLGKGGYVSYTEKLPPDWSQEMDADANPKLVDQDDRVQRRFRAA